MLLLCPNCATSYQLDPASLGAAGRSVRCVRCRKVWFAANPETIPSIAKSFHADVAALTGAAPADGGLAPEQLHDGLEAGLEAGPDTAGVPDRDDRGPGPLPEPRQYALPREAPMVDDAPALAPASETTSPGPAFPDKTVAATAIGAPPPKEPSSVPGNIELAAAYRIRRPLRRPSPWPSPGWTAAILALVAINIGLIAWRTEMVRTLPQTAPIYAALGLEVNLRNLVFSEIVTHRDTQDGAPMLVVEGVIKSIGKTATTVPRLRFAVRNAQGHEIYNWTALPARNMLAPGATLPFRSRLASPPAETQAVMVRFFSRRDLTAGTQ